MLRKSNEKLKRKPLERKQHTAADSCLNVLSNEAHKKPFAKVSFYLDLKDYFGIKHLTNDIKTLGGAVETFLSKDVKYLVTNRPNWKQHLRDTTLDDGSLPSTPNSFSNAKSCLTNDSPSNVELPIVKSNSNAVISRASALLEKARKSATKGSSDVLQIARMWGVKVLSLSFLTNWIKKAKSQLHVKRTHNPKDIGKSKSASSSSMKMKLSKPFLKFEDLKGEYRPQYRLFREWPILDLDAHHTRSPFTKVLQLRPNHKIEVLNQKSPSSDLASEGNLCNNELSRPTKNIIAQPDNGNTSTKKTAPGTKPGFCEMCLIRYEDVYNHIKTKDHQKHLTSFDLYTLLDKRIAALPDIFSFAKIFSQRSLSCSSTQTKTCNVGKANPAGHSKENFSAPLSEPVCRKRKKPAGTGQHAKKKVKTLTPSSSFSVANNSNESYSECPVMPKADNSLPQAEVINDGEMKLLLDTFAGLQDGSMECKALQMLDSNTNMLDVQCNRKISESGQQQANLEIEKSKGSKRQNAVQKEGIRLLRSTALRRSSVHQPSSKLASCPSFLPPCVNDILDSRQVKSSPPVSVFGNDRHGAPFGARRALDLDESFETDRNSTSLDAGKKLKCLVDEFRLDDHEDTPLQKAQDLTTPCPETDLALPQLESVLNMPCDDGLGWLKMPRLEKVTNVPIQTSLYTSNQDRHLGFHPQAINFSSDTSRNNLNNVFETALGLGIDETDDLTCGIDEAPLVHAFGVNKVESYLTNDIEKEGVDEPLDYSMTKQKSTKSLESTSNEVSCIVIDSSPNQSGSTVVNIISSPMEYNSNNASNFTSNNKPDDSATHLNLRSIPKFVFRRVRGEMQTQWTVSCIK